MKRNPYENYKEQSISTMTSGEMLTAVYDGLLKQIALAKKAIEAKDFAEVNAKLHKSQDFLAYLCSTLDFNYEISDNLNSLYEYSSRLLFDANIKKDSCANLDEVSKIITELRNTYVQADKITRSLDATK
ncbi:MAG: flagellar export chaperone FliS [Clostridia bacterium]